MGNNGKNNARFQMECLAPAGIPIGVLKLLVAFISNAALASTSLPAGNCLIFSCRQYENLKSINSESQGMPLLDSAPNALRWPSRQEEIS